MMRAALTFIALVLASGPLTAHAETCPDVPDSEVALRRSMAKEWFAKAEESEASGDSQAAIRRYACSLSLAPHPSTAYNLGAVSEKAGDLSAALDGFRAYLKLSPEASDRPAIEARIATIEAKIVELRRAIGPKTAPEPTAPAAAPVVVPPPPPPMLAAPSPPPRGKRRAGVIVGAGGVAALGTAVVLNVMARSKMDTCYSQWKAQMSSDALDHCDEAKPLAYTSYVLFGVAGAAGLASAALLLWIPEPSATAEQPAVALAPALMPGGAGLLASGHF
jgi:hypothetical protein